LAPSFLVGRRTAAIVFTGGSSLTHQHRTQTTVHRKRNHTLENRFLYKSSFLMALFSRQFQKYSLDLTHLSDFLSSRLFHRLNHFNVNIRSGELNHRFQL
jgi:hypothetical protein